MLKNTCNIKIWKGCDVEKGLSMGKILGHNE